MKTNGTKKKVTGKAARPSQPHGAGARHDKLAGGDRLSEFPGADGMDEPPMSLAPRVRRLSWGYALLSEVDGHAMEDLVVNAGTKVAIEGTLERLGYVYVVQIGEDKSVEVLFPPNGGSRRARPGAHMRLPSGTGWIVTTKKGKLRTITSPHPLTEQQIADLS